MRSALVNLGMGLRSKGRQNPTLSAVVFVARAELSLSQPQPTSYHTFSLYLFFNPSWSSNLVCIFTSCVTYCLFRNGWHMNSASRRLCSYCDAPPFTNDGLRMEGWSLHPTSSAPIATVGTCRCHPKCLLARLMNIPASRSPGAP